MKQLLSFILLPAILMITMSARPLKNSAVKNHSEKSSVDVYLNNGTAWTASANFGGNVFSEGPEDCGEVGSIVTGTWTVTLSTTAPGWNKKTRERLILEGPAMCAVIRTLDWSPDC